MLNEISVENRAIILLEFTRSLLMHSSYGEMAELKKVIKEEEQKKNFIKRENIIQEPPAPTIKEIVVEKEKGLQNLGKRNNEMEITKQLIEKPRIPIRIRPRVLRIPESRLPERLQYLKPTIQNIEIDIGKLNSLLHDPIVRRIECNGPGERIVVMAPDPKYTDIILNKDEIMEVIQVFEEKSKIPATEGIYKVVVGKFILSAIISEVIGSKFSINKMNYAPVFS
jgi:hypothetical protein